MNDNQIFFLTILLSLFQAMELYSQTPHLDVQGHSKIRGNLDIVNMEDTSSIYIGKNAGVNANNTLNQWNTFIGSNAGMNTMTSEDNSFFGFDAGVSNTTGNDNSFFGRYAGVNNTSGGMNSFLGFESGKDRNQKYLYGNKIRYSQYIG